METLAVRRAESLGRLVQFYADLVEGLSLRRTQAFTDARRTELDLRIQQAKENHRKYSGMLDEKAKN